MIFKFIIVEIYCYLYFLFGGWFNFLSKSGYVDYSDRLIVGMFVCFYFK